MKDPQAADKAAKNKDRKAKDVPQSFEEVTMLRELLAESQEREKAVRNELVAARLELKSYRATEKAFYEKLRTLGLPEGGYLIDTLNVFAELGKLRERVRNSE